MDPKLLATLAKHEILQSRKRNRITNNDLGVFPVWEITLFIFMKLCHGERVTVQQVHENIRCPDALTEVAWLV